MKTININLIGEFAKTVKPSGLEIQQDTLDSKTRIWVVAFIIGILVIFALSFGIWLVTSAINGKTQTDLGKLKTEYNELKKEETKLTKYSKNLKTQKAIAEAKIKLQKDVNSLFVPWSLILKDLATRIPRDIIITDISKVPGGQNMTISGITSSKSKAMTSISFLILNINEDQTSLLTNAKLDNIKYDKESNTYEFKIQAQLRPKKQEIKK